MPSNPCKFFIGDSKTGLSYDEMRQHLVENYDTLVEPISTTKQTNIADKKAAKVEAEMESKIVKATKPDISIPLLTNEELVSSKDNPVANRVEQRNIEKNQKELQRLINCLWA